MPAYVTQRQWTKMKIIALIITGVAIGTVVTVAVILWFVVAFIDGFN